MQGLKPIASYPDFAARLKSCPFTRLASSEVILSLLGVVFFKKLAFFFLKVSPY